MELGNHYAEILNQAVAEIKSARVSIAKQINTAANGVYWSLGKILSEKKVDKGHGSGVVNRLSLDLKAEFPEMGLSPRNLWNMKRFYERYAQADPKLQRCVAVKCTPCILLRLAVRAKGIRHVISQIFFTAPRP